MKLSQKELQMCDEQGIVSPPKAFEPEVARANI